MDKQNKPTNFLRGFSPIENINKIETQIPSRMIYECNHERLSDYLWCCHRSDALRYYDNFDDWTDDSVSSEDFLTSVFKKNIISAERDANIIQRLALSGTSEESVLNNHSESTETDVKFSSPLVTSVKSR